MKLTILIYLLIVILISPFSYVHGQTPTRSPSPTEVPSDRQIEDLKERLATKVAELRTLQRKAIAGKVKSQTVSSMTIETSTKDIKIELNDSIDVIQYLRGKRTELSVDDVDNGDFLVVFGQYDTTIDLLKASLLLIDNTVPNLRISGKITELDDEEFTINVNTSDNITYLVDVERTTNATEWTNGSIQKSGFSKLSIGDTVHILGTAVEKEDKRISATRILDLNQVVPEANPTPVASIEPTPTPTSGRSPTPTRATAPLRTPTPIP